MSSSGAVQETAEATVAPIFKGPEGGEAVWAFGTLGVDREQAQHDAARLDETGRRILTPVPAGPSINRMRCSHPPPNA